MSKSTKWHSRGLMHSIKRTDFIAWSRKKEPKRLPELETRVHCEARFHVSYTKRAKDDESREISNGPTPSAMHRICEKKKRNRCSREVVQSWPWFLMIFALQLGHPRFAVHNSKWSAFIFCSCLSASHEFRFRNLVLLLATSLPSSVFHSHLQLQWENPLHWRTLPRQGKPDLCRPTICVLLMVLTK